MKQAQAFGQVALRAVRIPRGPGIQSADEERHRDIHPARPAAEYPVGERLDAARRAYHVDDRHEDGQHCTGSVATVRREHELVARLPRVVPLVETAASKEATAEAHQE